MKTYLNLNEILAKLAISKTYFMKLKSNLKNIKYEKENHGYNLEEVCKAISSRPYKRRDTTDLRRRALDILEEIKKSRGVLEEPGKPEKEIPELTEINVSKSKTTSAQKHQTQSKRLDEFGLKGALYRVRLMEKLVYNEAKSDLTPEALDNWSRLVGDLVKTEEKILKILRERKELVAVATVNKWLASRLEFLKTTLLNIPPKMAPILDGLPWEEIQKKLNEEIRNSVEKIRNFTPNDEEKENEQPQIEDISTDLEKLPENTGAFEPLEVGGKEY